MRTKPRDYRPGATTCAHAISLDEPCPTCGGPGGYVSIDGLSVPKCCAVVGRGPAVPVDGPPLQPEAFVGALHDRAHEDVGASRPAKVARAYRCPSCRDHEREAQRLAAEVKRQDANVADWERRTNHFRARAEAAEERLKRLEAAARAVLANPRQTRLNSLRSVLAA